MATLLGLLFVLKIGVIDVRTDWFREKLAHGIPRPGEVRMEVNFDDKIALIGCDVSATRVAAGQTVEVTIFWKPLAPMEVDYVSSARLEGPQGQGIVAHDNLHPGEIPTSWWRLGKYVIDRHLLAIPADMRPVAASLTVGLWDRTAGAPLLMVGPEGSRTNASPRCGEVRITSGGAGDIPAIQRRADYIFDSGISFLGYTLAKDVWMPGEDVNLTLFWRAEKEVARDYTVFTHLVGENNHKWGQNDSQPVGGLLPTHSWVPGEVVADEYSIALDPLTPPGMVLLDIGMYDAQTGENVQVRRSDKKEWDNHIPLSSLAVGPR